MTYTATVLAVLPGWLVALSGRSRAQHFPNARDGSERGFPNAIPGACGPCLPSSPGRRRVSRALLLSGDSRALADQAAARACLIKLLIRMEKDHENQNRDWTVVPSIGMRL